MDTVLSETPTVSYLRTRRCCSLGRVDVAVMWTYLVLLDIGLLFGVIDGPVFSLGVLAPNFGRSAFSVVGSQRYILARRRRAYSTSVLRKRKRGQYMPKKLVVAGNGCCFAMVVSDRWLGPVLLLRGFLVVYPVQVQYVGKKKMTVKVTTPWTSIRP